MRTRAFPAAAAVALCALAAPVSAQIIATSIPKEFTTKAGTTSADKKWAFHIMGTPFAKWKYGEVYIGPVFDLPSVGTVQATPNSDFLFAGEVAFKAGENWSIGIGGWYNKIGQTAYDFSGGFIDSGGISVTAELDGDINIYEGHLGIFYKDFGVQGGLVKTSGRIGTNATLTSFSLGGQTFPCTQVFPPNEGNECARTSVATFEGDTTDWDVFAVYKHSWGSNYPVGISLGAGVYGKQGIVETSPLRGADNTTVFSGFATASIGIYKGLGMDVSYWYIDKTTLIDDLNELDDFRISGDRNDSQSRFTIGIGYTFSK